MQPLTDYQRTLARSRAYALLGRIFLNGLTADLCLYAAEMPVLASALPAELTTDDIAAAHQQLFGMNIFPFQSIFLDASGLAGGAESMRVQESYNGLGFIHTADAAPDHLGTELLAMASIAGAEADARRSGREGTVRDTGRLQQQFLETHLARWIVPVSIAIQHQGDTFYTAASALARDLVLDHLDATGHSMPLPNRPTIDLDAPQTAIHDIVTYLLTPLHSGLFISRDDLRAIGRDLELPSGFGNRRQLLANLLRAAGAYDLFIPTVDRLSALVQRWIVAYAGAGGPSTHAVAPWLQRAQLTASLLKEIRARAQPG